MPQGGHKLTNDLLRQVFLDQKLLNHRNQRKNPSTYLN